MTSLALIDLTWNALVLQPLKRLLCPGPGLARFTAAFRLAGRRSADAGAERVLLEACAAAGSPAHCGPTGVPLDRVIEVLPGRPVAAAVPTG